MISLSLFLCFLLLTIGASIHFTPQIKAFYQDCNGIYEAAAKSSAFLKELGYQSIFVFMGLQILQVIAAMIPGIAIQFAGGMVFGVFLGVIYSLLGITIGSLIVFAVSRIWGKKGMALFVKEETYRKFQYVTDSRIAGIVTFLLFLIPGLPKDVFVYILGLSSISMKKFLLFSTLGRLPGILGSCVLGYTYLTGQTGLAVIILAVSLLFCLLSVKYKDKIIAFISGKNVV